jgi:hypothetical protein
MDHSTGTGTDFLFQFPPGRALGVGVFAGFEPAGGYLGHVGPEGGSMLNDQIDVFSLYRQYTHSTRVANHIANGLAFITRQDELLKRQQNPFSQRPFGDDPHASAGVESRFGGQPIHRPRLAMTGGRGDEADKEGMRIIGPRPELGVELRTDEERMLGQFDDLDQRLIRGEPRKPHACLLQIAPITVVDFVPVPMSLIDNGLGVKPPS